MASELTMTASGQETNESASLPVTSESPPHSEQVPTMEILATEQSNSGMEVITPPLSTPDPSIPMRPNSLSRLPSELKQMIFFMAGGSAEAVAAFRGDISTYQDALKAYYQLTRFDVPSGVRIKDSPLNMTSLNSLKKLRLTLV